MILNGSLGAFHFTFICAMRSDTVCACAGAASRASESAVANKVFMDGLPIIRTSHNAARHSIASRIAVKDALEYIRESLTDELAGCPGTGPVYRLAC